VTLEQRDVNIMSNESGLTELIELLSVALALCTIVYNFATFIWGSPELRTIREEMNGIRDLLRQTLRKLE